jgi:hypothetical protein
LKSFAEALPRTPANKGKGRRGREGEKGMGRKREVMGESREEGLGGVNHRKSWIRPWWLLIFGFSKLPATHLGAYTSVI